MKYVYLIFNWGLGVLFLLMGILSLFEYPYAGIFLITASALLLPPVRSFFHTKTNKEITLKARVFSILALFITSTFFIGHAEDLKKEKLIAQLAQEKAERIAQVKQENVNYFKTNREQIISFLKKELIEKNYQEVFSQSNKYLASNDKELERINTQAKSKLEAIHKAERTENLLTKLKSIPIQEYEKNRSLYQQLLNMHPDNKLYRNKFAYYDEMLEEQKKRQIAEKERQKKIESQFSPWDGSHRNLERMIKSSMNDPDSYKHAKTVYWDQGDHLVVLTTFRGKNAFGAFVKNSVKAKISIDGKVLQILDQY